MNSQINRYIAAKFFVFAVVAGIVSCGGSKKESDDLRNAQPDSLVDGGNALDVSGTVMDMATSTDTSTTTNSATSTSDATATDTSTDTSTSTSSSKGTPASKSTATATGTGTSTSTQKDDPELKKLACESGLNARQLLRLAQRDNPPRGITPEQFAKIKAALKGVTEEQLEAYLDTCP